MAVFKTFRFLLNFAWVNLGAIIGFAVIVLAGCYLTGVPGGGLYAGNLFETYYAMFPTMILLCLFLYAFALCTSNLNLGLSMGARRRDFFWAIQGVMLFYTAVCWALQWFLSVFFLIAHWAPRERFSLLTVYNEKPLLYPALCLVALVLGCLGGLLMTKSKLLATLAILLSIFVLMGVTIFTILSAETGLMRFLNMTGWNALPQILAGILAASFLGGEFLIWRVIQRFPVR